MFETARLKLRAYKPEDAPVYCEWWNDAKLLALQTTLAVRPTTLEKCQETLKIWVGGSLFYACLETKEDGQLIGMINLWDGEAKNRDYKLAIIIGQPCWGQGYGREALGFLVNHAFKELGLHRISLQVAAGNDRAIRCYEAVGFQPEGVLRQATFMADDWHDEVLMGMLRADLPPLA